jgi:hypothetical protein
VGIEGRNGHWLYILNRDGYKAIKAAATEADESILQNGINSEELKALAKSKGREIMDGRRQNGIKCRMPCSAAQNGHCCAQFNFRHE